jgi:hypothetical protein
MSEIYFVSNTKEIEHRQKHGFQTKTAGNNTETAEADPAWLNDIVMRDLFIWTLLMNRVQMARVFLAHMKYRTCAALVASKIMREFSSRLDRGHQRDEYYRNARYFENYAIDCINKCEEREMDEAPNTLLYSIELYGYVTCLQVSELYKLVKNSLIIHGTCFVVKVAASAKAKKFIATPCCVQAVDNAWFDQLHPEQKQSGDNLRLVAGVLSAGIFAPALVKYRDHSVSDHASAENLSIYENVH